MNDYDYHFMISTLKYARKKHFPETVLCVVHIFIINLLIRRVTPSFLLLVSATERAPGNNLYRKINFRTCQVF